MSMDMTITGDLGVLRSLEQFSISVQKRLVERAGRAALKPLIPIARGRVPNGGGGSGAIRGKAGKFESTFQWKNSGQLKASIGVKKSKRVARGEVVLSVGPRRGFDWTDEAGKKHDPFYYGIPVEYGHDIKRDGQVVAHVAPAGFMRAAYEAGRLTIVEDFARELRERIEVEAMRP